SYSQSAASFLTPSTICRADIPGPDSNFRGTFCPVVRIFTCVPPTSTTSTFISVSVKGKIDAGGRRLGQTSGRDHDAHDIIAAMARELNWLREIGRIVATGW